MLFEDFIRWTRGQDPVPRTPEEQRRDAALLCRAKLWAQMAAEYPDPAEREAAIRDLMGDFYPAEEVRRAQRNRIQVIRPRHQEQRASDPD
jgi:hypothetical protein